MAKSGAQKGNTNGSRGKEWREAIRKAVMMHEDKGSGIERGKALHEIAITVVKQALEGEAFAIQEIGNRLDGKPHQSMDIGLSEDKSREEMTDDELSDRIARARELIGSSGNSTEKIS